MAPDPKKRVHFNSDFLFPRYSKPAKDNFKLIGGEEDGRSRDLFRQVGLAVHGKQDAYETLCKAEELWRVEGQPFSAGMAMLRAVHAAWGRPEVTLEAHHSALHDFERVVIEQPPNTPEALAAFHKLLQTLGRAL